MRNIILFDDDNWKNFLPLTFTRPIGELRVGIDTIREKWESALKGNVSYITKEYLSHKFPINIDKEENILISGSVLPTPRLLAMINELSINQALLLNDNLIAARLDSDQFTKVTENEELDTIKGIDLSKSSESIIMMNNIIELFTSLDSQIREDFTRLTTKRSSQPLPNSNTLIGKESELFIEEGANIEACILNTKTGPIYIGKNVTIMEGSMLRGPLALLDGTAVKMGAKIYGPTVIGKKCQVGGEVNNVNMFNFSNKSHEGYLGNAILGEWCNIGADTNASNLKNNYEEVKIWSYVTNRFEKTGLQKCGLIMGDHSKTGINTMLNTGTVVGVNANIYGDGFPRNFVPSFAWGGASGFITYQIDKAIDTATKAMKSKGVEISEGDKIMLKDVFETSREYRTWDNSI
jgi:UDP-N-acetylglucosamine diphosphorylase/glucosamine-1-phosphate N-acetyltransferase